MKERITVTLEKELIRQIDDSVDGKRIKNRSHAMEMMLYKAIGGDVPRKAVILAGGKGTRLRPITYELPKALIPVHGKSLTEHLFDLFKKYGIRDIIICVGHMKEKIKDYFGDGSKFGVNITYIEEKEPLGTAGPLALAKEILKEPFIVTNGDELKKINIPKMYRLHKQKKAKVTIALTTVNDPSQYGVARMDGSKIMEFVEKPKKDKAPSNLINSGFYIMEPDVVNLIPKKQHTMLEKDIFPKLAEQSELRGFIFSGQWYDTGNIERYEKALKEWKDIDMNEEY